MAREGGRGGKSASETYVRTRARASKAPGLDETLDVLRKTERVGARARERGDWMRHTLVHPSESKPAAIWLSAAAAVTRQSSGGVQGKRRSRMEATGGNHSGGCGGGRPGPESHEHASTQTPVEIYTRGALVSPSPPWPPVLFLNPSISPPLHSPSFSTPNTPPLPPHPASQLIALPMLIDSSTYPPTHPSFFSTPRTLSSPPVTAGQASPCHHCSLPTSPTLSLTLESRDERSQASYPSTFPTDSSRCHLIISPPPPPHRPSSPSPAAYAAVDPPSPPAPPPPPQQHQHMTGRSSVSTISKIVAPAVQDHNPKNRDFDRFRFHVERKPDTARILFRESGRRTQAVLAP